MAEPSPGLTRAKPSWLQAWHIRDETLTRALPGWFATQPPGTAMPAAHWGDGTTSSLRCTAFRAGGRREAVPATSTPKVTAKAMPGRLRSYISDHAIAPAKQHPRGECRRPVILHLCARRPLLHHESGPVTEEHYTDTAVVSPITSSP